MTTHTLSKSYQLKEASIGKLTTFSGAQIREHRLPENPRKRIWSMSANKYLKEALHNMEKMLLQENMHLPTKISTPLTSNYCPELDTSPLWNALQHNLYQQFAGILHGAVELGSIDIHLPVALMAQYLAQPRIGHIQQIFHIFA